MQKPSLHQVEPPPDAIEKGGHEVLRCFVVDGGLSIALRRSFDDPSAWGVMLADLARHAARTYALEANMSEADALDSIKSMFDDEFSHDRDVSVI